VKAISFFGYRRQGYQETSYLHPFGGEPCFTEFFQEALIKFYHPETLYVLLTETARTGRVVKDGVEADRPTWDLLCERLEGKVHLQPINIPEGKNEAQLWEIFHGLTDHLHEGDSVLFDITNGFRSLPLLSLIAIFYLRVVRNIRIEGLIYGAFDARNERNESPVFDLTPFVELLDWTTATSQFLQTGDATSLIQSLGRSEDRARESGVLRAAVSSSPGHTTLPASPDALGNTGRLLEDISNSLLLFQPLPVMAATTPENLDPMTHAAEAFSRYAPPFSLLLERIRTDLAPFGQPDPWNPLHKRQTLQRQAAILSWYLNRTQPRWAAATALAKETLISALCVQIGEPVYAEDYPNTGRYWVNAALKPDAHDSDTLRHYRGRLQRIENLDEYRQLNDRLSEIRNQVMHCGMSNNIPTDDLSADLETHLHAVLDLIQPLL
jgi:hypothetical protein